MTACPGRRLAMSGSLLGICLACARQVSESREPIREWLEPAATQHGPQRVWVCANEVNA